MGEMAFTLSICVCELAWTGVVASNLGQTLPNGG